MPARRGLALRGAAVQPVYTSRLRQGHNLTPPAGGVKAVTDRPAGPARGGLRLRGASVVPPPPSSSNHPMARSSPAKAVMGRTKVVRGMGEYAERELRSSRGKAGRR